MLGDKPRNVTERRRWMCGLQKYMSPSHGNRGDFPPAKNTKHASISMS